MAVLITTEVLGEISVLTSVENQSELTTAWIRSGDGLIGFGQYKKIEIYRRTVNNQWLLSDVKEDEPVVFETIQCSVSLNEIYNKVQFTDSGSL